MPPNSNSLSITCPICGEIVTFYCQKDSAIYYLSRRCGLIFQSPLPTTQDMVTYADEEYSGGLYKQYIEAKDLKYGTFRSRLPKIRAALPNGGKNGKLLDVGCSCGYFLDVALEAGFDAQGIEFSSVAISMASPATRPRIIQGDVNALDSTQRAFDVITAFDIIEHTDNPLDFLQNLKSILKPSGVIALTTPDTGHFLRPLMGSRWPMLQPLQHTFLFSKASLSQALQIAGFIDVEITSAYKVLTLDYLIKQLEIHNPLIYRFYRLVSPLIPKTFREKPIHVNIGEIFAIARRPNL